MYGRTVVAAEAKVAGDSVQARGAIAHCAPNVTAQDVVEEAPIVICPDWSPPEIDPFVPVPHAPLAMVGAAPLTMLRCPLLSDDMGKPDTPNVVILKPADWVCKSLVLVPPLYSSR